MKVLVTHSCLTLCDPMDCSLPGFSVHGILQTIILEWVAIPFSRGSSWPRNQTQVSCTPGRFFTIWPTREASSFIHVVACVKIFFFLKNFYCSYMGFPCGSDGKESACNAGDLGLITEFGRSPGSEDPLEEGMATDCNIIAWRMPMNRGAWWATVYGVAKSQKQLSN